MPVHVSWDDDAKTTVRWDYEGKWTWDEVAAALEQSNTMIRTTDHSVSIIHNLTASAGIPSGALTQAHRFTASQPENWDLTVVVGSGGFIDALVNVFGKVYRKLGEHYRAARTLDDARSIIARQKENK